MQLYYKCQGLTEEGRGLSSFVSDAPLLIQLTNQFSWELA